MKDNSIDISGVIHKTIYKHINLKELYWKEYFGNPKMRLRQNIEQPIRNVIKNELTLK